MRTKKNDPTGRRVLWMVIAVFAVQITVWTLWIRYASKNRVAEVPLVTTR